jgi:hypothetical protein
MRESNSRNWSHNPAPKPFGQSRHQIWSWSSESNTRRRGTSSLHYHCARPANFLELARSLELRSGAYHAPALPVELYQRSWRGDTITPTSQHQACRGPRFERRSRTYEARALPTELHQHKTLEVAGRIALPMICFAGRRLSVLATPPQTVERSTGIAPVFPDWRSGVLLLYELRPG